MVGRVDPQGGQDAAAGAGGIVIRGSRLLLRALRPAEIDDEWRAMVTADPMAIATLPDEAGFRARLQQSGQMRDGCPIPPGTYEVGIGLRGDTRGNGYGREALALLTDWLFEHAAAQVVEAPTDPANIAMRTVFQRVGWTLVGPLTEFDRQWVMYKITRREWEARPRPFAQRQ